MKITELVDELNRIKAIHGDLEVSTCDSETGNPDPVRGVCLVYPLKACGLYDRSKPPYSVMLVEWDGN